MCAESESLRVYSADCPPLILNSKLETAYYKKWTCEFYVAILAEKDVLLRQTSSILSQSQNRYCRFGYRKHKAAAVDKELKDSRPAINDFDCGVFFFLEAF